MNPFWPQMHTESVRTALEELLGLQKYVSVEFLRARVSKVRPTGTSWMRPLATLRSWR